MKYYYFLLIALFYFSVDTAVSQNSCIGVDCLPKKLQNICIESTEKGCIDWSFEAGEIYATGYGKGRHFPIAKRAAKLDAMRNILEIIKGVNLNSSTRVEQNSVVKDTIVTKVRGKVRWLEEVGEPEELNDGTIKVIVRLEMKKILPDLLSQESFKKLQYQRIKEPSKTDQLSKTKKPSLDTMYTGLIIDATQTNVTPAASPKVYDERGKEIYGSAYIEREFAISQGMVGYEKDIERAKQNDRVKGNPLVIQALKSKGNNFSDIVIQNNDAEFLEKICAIQSFCRETRIIVLLK